jgi:predicted AAA+ superfamily ATPase
LPVKSILFEPISLPSRKENVQPISHCFYFKRTEKSDVFISGSSAKMLSKELATQMRGRSIAWELFTFSFKEFADYKNVDLQALI